MHLAVKQYIPLDNPNPQPGDVTIIAAHANGFPKVRRGALLLPHCFAFCTWAKSDLFLAQELYEPLWEELLARSKANGFRIRSIWMADVAHQGQSGVINEDLLGNDRM